MILLLIIQLMHQIKEKLRENMAKVTEENKITQNFFNQLKYNYRVTDFLTSN